MLLHRINSLVRFLLLNACALPSSGLYQGKVGVALALFEASKVLKNEEFENQAAELLQEALLTKTDDISFEKGLSGIGFVLRYLILEKYIDADYEELFGDKTNHIIEKAHILFNENKLYSDVCILLDLLGVEKKFETNVLKSRDLYHESLFEKMTENPLGNFPVEIIQKQWQDDLYIACSCRNYKVSGKSISAYNKLYQTKTIGRNHIIGYYLMQLGKRMKSDEITMLGNDLCEAQGLLSDKCRIGLLHERLQNEFIGMQSYKTSEKYRKEFYDFYIDCNEEIFESRLSSIIPSGMAGVGLKYGVARLVMQMCWLCQDKCSENTRRMYNTILS